VTLIDSSAAAGSEVSRTLAGGFHWLRFEPALEREFVDTYRESIRVRVRISLCLAFSTVIGFALLDRLLIDPQSPGVPDLIRFGIHLPVVIACLVLTSRRYYRWYWPVIHVGAPLFGLGTVLMEMNATPEGLGLIHARLVLATFFFYFMLGLKFYDALRTNLIVLFGFGLAALAASLPPGIAIYQFFVLVCANLFAGAGCYALEHANRSAFLERRLLTEVATHDGLTGLLNRATLETEVRRAWQRSAARREPLSVIMIDIDSFKAYNDRYGHQSGDDCLRAVAGAVRRVAARRDGDLVARYGGEELIAVLPGTDRTHAERVAQDLITAVTSLRIAHDTSRSADCVTVSVGVATVNPTPESSHEAAIRVADRALYAAKDAGRDRYVVFDGRRAAPADALRAANA
jgi:diguanylate cyclase (GGDEF)-like protein